MSVAAVVLAAGGSRRLGEPKQLLRDHNGETLVHRIARQATEAGYSPIVIVLGFEEEAVRAAVADLAVLFEVNERWMSGISTSIRAGVAAAMEAFPERQGDYADVATEYTDSNGNRMLNIKTTRIRYGEVDAALLLTCDMPTVGAEHLHTLLKQSHDGRQRVASSYGDTIGIPAIIPAIEFLDLQLLDGDKGAKALLSREGTVLVPLSGGTVDLDTPKDVARWRADGSL